MLWLDDVAYSWPRVSYQLKDLKDTRKCLHQWNSPWCFLVKQICRASLCFQLYHLFHYLVLLQKVVRRRWLQYICHWHRNFLNSVQIDKRCSYQLNNGARSLPLKSQIDHWQIWNEKRRTHVIHRTSESIFAGLVNQFQDIPPVVVFVNVDLQLEYSNRVAQWGSVQRSLPSLTWILDPLR